MTAPAPETRARRRPSRAPAPGGAIISAPRPSAPSASAPSRARASAPRQALAVAMAALLLAAPAPGRADAPEAAPTAAAPGASPEAEPEAPPGLLFAPRPFEEVATGDRIVFRFEREADPADPRLPPFDGTATVSLVEADDRPGRAAQVVIAGPDGETEATPPLPEAAGHPLLLVFLESTVSVMAAATGGNPSYIRSRLREALWLEAEGEPVSIDVGGKSRQARAIEVRPFAEDPARDEMGGFAELALRFVVSDAVPGGLALLQSRSEAGAGLPAITSRITYDRLEAAEE